MDVDNRFKRNYFINRCFRDVADTDYLAARTCYKSGLLDQFLWCGLQALEKYLKSIILYHDGNTKNLGHDLNKAVRKVEQIQDIQWDFSKSIKDFFVYLTNCGSDRYFTLPRGTKGEELLQLDEAVWTVRRYCQDFQWLKDSDAKDGGKRFDSYIRLIQSQDCRNKANKFRLHGHGYLEKLLESTKPSKEKEILIWKNFFYGRYKKHRFPFTFKMSGRTPGHFLFPEIYDWVEQRVVLPSDVKNHFAAHAGNPSKAKKTSGKIIIQSTGSQKRSP